MRKGASPGLPTLTDRDGPSVFGQMLAYAAVVLALGGGVVFVAKRYFPRAHRVSGGKLRVIDSVYLGPRKQLHVLEAGSQRFLLASSRDSVSMISELTGSFYDVYETKKADGAAVSTDAGDLEDTGQ